MMKLLMEKMETRRIAAFDDCWSVLMESAMSENTSNFTREVATSEVKFVCSWRSVFAVMRRATNGKDREKEWERK